MTSTSKWVPIFVTPDTGRQTKPLSFVVFERFRVYCDQQLHGKNLISETHLAIISLHVLWAQHFNIRYRVSSVDECKGRSGRISWLRKACTERCFGIFGKLYRTDHKCSRHPTAMTLKTMNCVILAFTGMLTELITLKIDV
ncbi:hypothetical protein L596_019724 [Steinernema carpocapsae]|uniref:Uncharacterized protein n=1 Tax=Steinernema carpocapsae TaxID=34508 RepID=A0A4U5MRL4_STECR|nr:hypothetical protein L596_019724 [Steinernema carpocapsae]